jgi:hypothetical protein
MARLLGSARAAALLGLLAASMSSEGQARPIGKHKTQQVVVATAPAQAPAVYAAQAPVVYTAQAPAAYTAQAPTVYTAQAPSVASAPTVTYYYPQAASAPAATTYVQMPAAAGAPAVGNAPGTAGCPPMTADERADIVSELRGIKAENKDATPSERRRAVRERAMELVAEYCGKDSADDLDADAKALVRSLVSEALGSAPTSTNGTYSASWGGYPAAYPYGAQSVVPAAGYPTVIPVIPVMLVAPVAPQKHCLHHLFCPCAWCRGKGY